MPESLGRTGVLRGGEILEVFAAEGFKNVMWNKLYKREDLLQFVCPEGRLYEDHFVMNRLLPALAREEKTVLRRGVQTESGVERKSAQAF